MVSAGVIVSAPRVPASSAASSIASRGWTAVAPTASSIAIAWTSRTSAASTTRSVRPRRPASVSAVWTAPAPRIDGTGRRSNEKPRSERTMTSTPARAAATASAASRVEGGLEAAGAVGRAPRRVELLDPWSPLAARRRAARRGRRRSAGRGGASAGRAAKPPSSAGRRPSSTRRSMTIRSRSGSIAGFVTWANAWRRWSATGRSRRPRPAVGVSSPMLQSGSWASSAMVLMSRRARSASRPAR